MVKKEIRDQLAELNPDIIVFDNPSFDGSIIGVSEDYQHAIYDYHKMVKELAKDGEMTEEEAMEFVDFNTVRTAFYIGKCNPIIICTDCFY